MINIFISCSHQDEEWKDRLLSQVKKLGAGGVISAWETGQVEIGDDWLKKFDAALKEADAVLLLISADYLTSNFIRNKEIPSLLEYSKKKGLKILPVIVRPCPWKMVPWLSKMEVFPADGIPLASGDAYEIEDKLAKLVSIITKFSSRYESERENLERIMTARPEDQLRALAAYLEADRLAPGNAEYLNMVGMAYNALGEYRQALDYFEKARAIDEKAYGKKHPDVATRLNNLGSAHQALGDHRKAISYYEQALSIDEAVFGKEHPNVARESNNLGAAYLSLGDKAKAKPYLQTAYDIFKKLYGDLHPNTQTIKKLLDRC